MGHIIQPGGPCRVMKVTKVNEFLVGNGGVTKVTRVRRLTRVIDLARRIVGLKSCSCVLRA